MDNDFDSISWRNDPGSDSSRPNTAGPSDAYDRNGRSSAGGKRRESISSPSIGENADGVDLGGIGNGRLDCTVNTPLKENDGTKDAYISYLVTTHVGCLMNQCFRQSPFKLTITAADGLQILYEIQFRRAPSLHRLCLSLQNPSPRIPCLRGSSPPRQTQDGIRPWWSLRPRLHAKTSSFPPSFFETSNSSPNTSP